MTKKSLIISIAAITVLLSGYLLFSNKSQQESTPAPGANTPPTTVIESDDGLAYLSIPDDALPVGTSTNGITIKRVPSEAGIVAYELSPNGLAFNNDIFFKTTVDHHPDGYVPMMHHISQNGQVVEMIEGQEVVMNLETGKTVLSGPISSFSDIYVTGVQEEHAKEAFHAFFQAGTEASGAMVGEQPSVHFYLAKDPKYYEESYRGMTWVNELRSTSLKGFLVSVGEAISPRVVLDRPQSTMLESLVFRVQANDFTCIKKGKAQIIFKAVLILRVLRTFKFSSAPYPHEPRDLEERTVFLNVMSPSFECKAKPICGDDKIDPDNCERVVELGCNENTWEDETWMWDNSAKSSWVCKDDCPEGQTCNIESCTCQKDEDSPASADSETGCTDESLEHLLGESDCDRTITEDEVENELGPCADEQPANDWLGKWTAGSYYEETERVWDWWFEVSKIGSGYQIQTHTEGPDKTEIVNISPDTLEFFFNDALGTHITITREGDAIKGTVDQPNNSGLPHGIIMGLREFNPCVTNESGEPADQ